MNKNEYRRAVSQVRWSEEQRRNIEARLRALPQNDSEEIRADEEDGFVEVFRMDTKQLRARQREIEKEEKRSRIMGRIGWAVVAAGMVAAVGLFGAFAAKTRKLKQDVKYGDQGRSKGLRLTDEESADPTWSFAEGPDGYYDFSIRYDTVMQTMPDGQQRSSVRAVNVLYFTDSETGERKPVCARENCEHDGNPDCTASTAAYSVFCRSAGADTGSPERMYFTYGAGALYTVATKWDDPDAVHTADETGTAELGEQVLLRCEADGSALTEVTSFGTGYGEYKPVYHRGYLFFPVQLVTEGSGTQPSAPDREQGIRSGGYEIWGLELETGTLVKLYSAMPDSGADRVNPVPYDLHGVGDYLYFNCDDENIGTVTRRINLRTASVEDISNLTLCAGCEEQYGLYLDETKDKPCWYRTDPESGEQMLLSRFTGSAVPHLTDGYIVCEYLSAYGDAARNLTAGSVKKLELCDTDGQRIREIELPDLPDAESGRTGKLELADIANGKVYLHMTVSDAASGTDSDMDVIYCQTLDEIAGGNGSWTAIIDKTIK